MNTKNKSKVKKSSISTRLRNGMIVIFLIMILLIVRLGWLQFFKGSWLKEQMYNKP